MKAHRKLFYKRNIETANRRFNVPTTEISFRFVFIADIFLYFFFSIVFFFFFLYFLCSYFHHRFVSLVSLSSRCTWLCVCVCVCVFDNYRCAAVHSTQRSRSHALTHLITWHCSESVAQKGAPDHRQVKQNHTEKTRNWSRICVVCIRCRHSFSKRIVCFVSLFTIHISFFLFQSVSPVSYTVYTHFTHHIWLQYMLCVRKMQRNKNKTRFDYTKSCRVDRRPLLTW